MHTLDSDGPIVPLTKPENMPPVLSNEDLRQRWRSLMGDGGFGRTSLYLIWFEPSGRQMPLVMPIDDLDESFDQAGARQLMWVAENAVKDVPDLSLAMAFTRPGSSMITERDRLWGRALQEAIAATPIKVWPLHLCTENVVRPLTGDDLI